MREVPIYTLNFGSKFKEGLESILYYYIDPEYYDDEVLYKRFRSVNFIQDFNQDVKDNMLENKKDKILMIPTLNCFKDEVKIMDLGIERGKVQGYTLKKSSLSPIYSRYVDFKTEDGEVKKLIYFSPKRKELSVSDKIKYLKLLKDKITKFNNSDVYIGDFNYENFLVSDNLDYMKLCDLDNLKIGSHDFDNKTASVKLYEEKCIKEGDKNPNIEGLDSFCFNIYTLALLSDEPNFRILKGLDSIELPEILDDYPNRDIIDSMKHLDKTYKPRFLVDIFS